MFSTYIADPYCVISGRDSFPSAGPLRIDPSSGYEAAYSCRDEWGGSQTTDTARIRPGFMTRDGESSRLWFSFARVVCCSKFELVGLDERRANSYRCEHYHRL